jgi:hypothetical protein
VFLRQCGAAQLRNLQAMRCRNATDGSVAKNILATFCSSDELVIVTASRIVIEFLQHNQMD